LTFQDGRALRARYVVGADGGHSKVREKAGIEFAGSSYPVSVVLADVDVVLDPDRAQFAAERDEDRVRGFLTPDGTMAVVPLPSGRWRVAAPVVDAVEKPGLDDIRALLHARGPGSIPGEVVGLDWASHFRVHRRHASHYRVGRVLLAGDAAHVHSPVAGQGMNVGIQDGASLGRKLAAVLGGADPGLLDQYAAERQEIAEKVITTTDRLTRSLLIHSRLACAIRNTLLRIGLASSRAQRRMAFVNSQLVYRGK
jgi:2-polyprenyl-6-methoxyphenol hydroxylase-like FAD-dependent oxidoreductase